MAQRQRGATPAKSPFRYFYWAIGAIAIIGIAALVTSVIRSHANGPALTPVAALQNLSTQELYAKAKPVVLGKSTAPARLVVFSNYECPHCAEWAATIQPRLTKDYVDTGKLQIVYYDFPFASFPYSFLAARAARCAGAQGQYWTYHDQIFGHQAEWSYAGSAPVGLFEDYAKKLGLDSGKFSTCLEGDQYADVVTANALLGEQLGVNSTPTVIINAQQLSSPFDYSLIQQAIGQGKGAGATSGATAGSAAP